MDPIRMPGLAVPVSAVDMTMGAPDARVTIVEYADFECPSCKQAAPAVTLLLERFAGLVRFTYRHFPLEDAHPHALNAALAAESAGAQRKFWEMHGLLFANQQHLKMPQLRRYAEQLELDMARFDGDVSDGRYLPRIREQIAGGKRSGVRSTPAFFINGTIQDVSFGLHLLEQGVDAALNTRSA